MYVWSKKTRPTSIGLSPLGKEKIVFTSSYQDGGGGGYKLLVFGQVGNVCQLDLWTDHIGVASLLAIWVVSNRVVEVRCQTHP